LEIVLTPREAFHVRTIYSDTFEKSINSSTHQGTFMSEEFKIMPTEGSAEIASLLPVNQTWDALPGEIEYHPRVIPNDPSNNTSNYDIFKTSEGFPLFNWDSCISDFPLKNAPCKNAHPLSLLPFELHLFFISAFVPHWPSFSSL
jgi:hypothetical protein